MGDVQREAEKQVAASRHWYSPGNRKNRPAEVNERLDRRAEEHRALVAQAKASSDKKNAETLALRKAAGLVWTPVADGGGDEAGAVFSSSVIWDSLRDEIRDGQRHEPSLHLRDVCHLFWALNAIKAAGGSLTIPSGAGRLPLHWPAYDVQAADGIKYREDSVRHLAKLGYLNVEQGAGTITLTYGPVTLALTESQREHAA